MTNHCVSILAFAFLAALSMSQATYTGSINTINAPNATSNAAQDLQMRRDSWCNGTTVGDSNFNSSQQFYYRAVRGNFLGYWVGSVVNYLNGGTAIQFIQNIKWPFGLLLTVLCIAFISWVFFLVFVCAFRKQVRNDQTLTACLRLAKILLFLIGCLFIIIMIFIAFSEIYQRHSKCQLLNVGNMLVNGYVSQMNGNQYVGLSAMGQAVINFQNDAAGAATVYNNANNILGSNYPSATSNAIYLLQQVAANYSSATTTSALGQVNQPFSIRNLNGFVSVSAGVEFKNLFALGSTLDAAAKAVVGIVQNNGQAVGSQNIQTTVTTLNNFFTNLTSDVTTTANDAYNQVKTQYTWATGSYWSIFAISLVIIVISNFIVGKLMAVQHDPNHPRDFKLLKILLAVLGFFLVWYAILTIILLAGSASIATFCTILAQVNQGNLSFLDTLNINWTGNSKQVIKECTVGPTGNLWNFLALRPDAASAVYSNNIQNIILGIINYNNFYVNPQVNGSSSIAYLNSNYQAVKNGIINDYVGVSDQFNFIYASWPYNTTGKVLSLTQFNCTALSAANQTNCLPIDSSPLTAFDANPSNPSYANFTIVRNLQSYIQSEQALLTQIQQNLHGRTDIITPGQAFHNVRVSLDANRNDVRMISAQFANTIKPFSQYQGQAIYTFDCRNVKRELNILEDQYCFSLNYWVNNLLIVVCISLLLIFILTWTICGAIREADTEGEISNFPIPVEERKADINEREMIPQA